MTDRRAIAVVARREISSRVRERSFLVSTSVTILILIAVGILPAMFGAGDPKEVTVAAPGGDAVRVIELAAQGDEPFDLVVTPRRTNTAAEARRLVEDETADAAVVDGEIVSKGELDGELGVLLQQASAQARRSAALEGAELSAAQRRDALEPPPLRVSTLDADASDDEEKTGIASLAVILLYGQLLIYGYWISAGIVEEKASRVVEVLLAAIRPRALLLGKLLGIGLLGFAQLLLVGVVGAGTIAATGALDVPSGAWEAVAIVLAFFVFGYALYAALFSVAGALVPRQEDLQSSTMPLTIIILVSFFAALSAVGDPGGTLAQVLTFVPPCAPMVVPVRVIVGDVALWEVVASVALILVTAAALVAAAIRIYTNAILRTGGRVSLADAWNAR